jgi:hypothetical protein
MNRAASALVVRLLVATGRPKATKASGPTISQSALIPGDEVIR